MSVNIRPYIIINGKSSNEITGLMITSLPPITKPAMRVSAEEIDGRDGDIVTELGYSAYDKPIEIALVGNYNVDNVISYFNQSGIITFSNEPDKYYKFAQYDGIDYEKLIKYKTAKVNFHVQPYKYSTESNDAVFYSPTNVTVTNAGNTYSRPSLAIQGSGDVEIDVNGSQALQIELGDAKQAIIIDSDEMNAYGTKSNIKELITEINPVQDLNGYDHAWIGGAGKNKLIKSYTSQTINGVTFTVNSDGSVNVNGTATSTALFHLGTLSNFLTNDTSYIVNGNTNTNAYLQLQTSQFGGVVNVGSGYQFTYTTGGEIQNLAIRVDTGKTASNVTLYPMIRLASVSDASFEPYENICDISGWNGCDISRTGKNLAFAKIENCNIDGNGNLTSYSAFDMVIAPVKKNVTYTATNNETNQFVAGFFTDIPAMSSVSYNGQRIVATSKTITSEIDGFIAFRIPHDFENYQFEIGSQATSYEKYVGSKYQQFFEGLMAGTYGFVDLGSLTWQKNGVNRFTSTNQPDDIKAPASQTAIANVICPIYQTSNFSTTYGENVDDVIAINTNNAINIVNKEYSDASDFKNAMSGVYLIYELATATTPSITQEDISNLVADFNADLVCVVFGQEVFGGHLNVTTGLLTIDKVIINNISNYYRDFNTGTYSTCYRITLPTLSTNIPYSQKHGAISNCAREETGYYGANRTNEAITASGIFAINPAGEIMAIYDPDTSLTKATFESKYANFEAVYPLANPVEIQLTAQDVMTLIGKNNIMSNTGAISELIYTHAGADVTAHGDIVSFDVDASDLKDNILKNRLVTGNYDNLMLKAGANQLGITGDVDVIVLSNFSRWL